MHMCLFTCIHKWLVVCVSAEMLNTPELTIFSPKRVTNRALFYSADFSLTCKTCASVCKPVADFLLLCCCFSFHSDVHFVLVLIWTEQTKLSTI